MKRQLKLILLPIVLLSAFSYTAENLSELRIHQLMHSALDNLPILWGINNKPEVLDALIDNLKNRHTEEKQEEVINAFADCFACQGADINDTLIDPLLQKTINDTVLYEYVLDVLAQAMIRSLKHVHPETLLILESAFEKISAEKKDDFAKELAESASRQISELPPQIILRIAKMSEHASIMIAHAAANESEGVNRMCIHTIPLLAQMTPQTKTILESCCMGFSPLDKYLLNDHSAGAAICAACKGGCKFHEDWTPDNLAKLIKGIRSICLEHDYSLVDDPELFTLPEMQEIYCTENCWFTPEGEDNAKMLHLTTLYPANPYIFGKILGYKEEDIDFFYVRCAHLEGKTTQDGQEELMKDRAFSDHWFQSAKQRIQSLENWQPKKLIDVIQKKESIN